MDVEFKFRLTGIPRFLTTLATIQAKIIYDFEATGNWYCFWNSEVGSETDASEKIYLYSARRRELLAKD
jgi:hypothetical protein